MSNPIKRFLKWCVTAFICLIIVWGIVLLLRSGFGHSTILGCLYVSLILLGVVMTFAGIELFPAVLTRLRFGDLSSCRKKVTAPPPPQVLKNVLNTSRRQLKWEPLPSYPSRSRSFCVYLWQRYIRKQRIMKPHDWPMGTLAWGITTHLGISKNSNDLSALQCYADTILTANGELKDALCGLGQCQIGYSILELWEQTGEERYKRGCEAIAEYLLDSHPRHNNILLFEPRLPTIGFVDTLAFVCPFLCRYGAVFERQDGLELALVQLNDFIEHGLEAKSKLPYHGYDINTLQPLGLAEWGRGVGWFLLGLTDTLVYLPKTQAHYEKLRQVFCDVLAAVATCRQDDGTWGCLVNTGSTITDTGATAMIGYAIEQGLRLGILDGFYEDVSLNAYQGCIGYINRQGLVCQSQQQSLGIGFYPKECGHNLWGQGATTAWLGVLSQRNKAL